MELYERVRITGNLEVLSDLHLGSGHSETVALRDSSEGSLIAVLRGDDDRPYVPASSLRGYLRTLAQQQLKPDQVNILFGNAKEDTRQTGSLRVANAFFASTTTHHRYGIALDAMTATVKNHKLFKHEVIPVGASMQCVFTLEHVDQALLQLFCSLLNQWDGLAGSNLGAMTGQGFGRVIWQQQTIHVLTPEKIVEWLKSDTSIADYYAPLSLTVPPTHKTKALLKFELHTQDPIVVHDPRWIQTNIEHSPKITCSRTDDGKALIPGKSLKGLLRAWCRKIVMTILVQHYTQTEEQAETIANSYINNLFGTEKLASYIRFSDAISPDQLIKHIRPMIAIDRFSGGVKGGQYLSSSHEQRQNKEEKLDGALLSIEAASNSQYRGDISFHLTRQAPQGDGWKGLLILALRDAMQGDFRIGWGKVRGFGAFTMQLKFDQQHYSHWDMLQTALTNKFSIDEWVTALHDELARHCQGDHPAGEIA